MSCCLDRQVGAACVALVTWFDSNAAAMGKVLWNPATGFGVSIELGCNGVEACIILFAAVVAFPATGSTNCGAWRSGLLRYRASTSFA